MAQTTVKPDWNAAASLRKVIEAEPWFGIALIYLLKPEQWASLSSGEVFDEIRQSLVRMAGFTHGALPGRVVASEDAASEALCRLATRAFLDRYDAEKGPPKPYMLGVAWRYLHADRKSRFRRLRRESPAVEEPASDEGSDAAAIRERSDTLALVLAIIDALPPGQRDAILRRYSIAGNADASKTESTKDYVRRCRGLARVRAKLRDLGLL